jgi:flagellin-like hook-associated protein FlgL
MMISNLSYWTEKQLERFYDAQTVVASGREVNKASDNPKAMGGIMSDTVTISECAQYEANIQKAALWIELGSTTLETVSSLLSSAKEIVESASTDSTGAADYAEQLQSIYDQIVSLANTKEGSVYTYSGSSCSTEPFSNTTGIADGTAGGIKFGLVDTASSVTITITDSSGAVVRTISAAGGSEGINTVTWDGRDDSGTLLADGEYSFSVAATDASGSAVDSYLAYQGGEKSKTAIIGSGYTVTLNNDGDSIFSDAISSLAEAISALNSSSGSCSTSDLVDALQGAIDTLTSEQVTLSNVNSQLDLSESRIEQLNTYVSGNISTLQGSDTADIEAATIEMQTLETAHESALETTSAALNMKNLVYYINR